MLNRCDFIGRLGRDVETRYTQAGEAVSSFSIACSEKYKDKGGNQQEKTEWVNVTAWGKLAEICSQYLEKGSLVYVSGKMQTRKWKDQNGNDRFSTEIVAREMKMLSPRSGDGDGRDGGYVPDPPSAGGFDDSVPF